MARPATNWITFEIDGREVRAPEGSMLVDAAKHGDVEIPYFCYEPKLGQPVGACRMCLVEIEGIPKLQTSCSTPVRDGMVVNTTSDRVKHAQNAIVEFLLVNHPLDCPVCDKGGECPLQDISFGWGLGRSRFIEPKRHFKKPLELSPLVAIDRERCILCYRCVRFSQEVAEDHQLVFLERGDHTFVGTHHGRPYVAPFSGNIIELCPVGALTSTAYRFRARPWDIEGSGTVCTLCPSQCNVELTVRDDTKVVRVLARDNEEVDDGWLCDKGRFGYQAFGSGERITAPLVRDGGFLREVSWERALSEAARALERSGAATRAVVGGGASNEEGFLVQHLLRAGLGSERLESAAGPVGAAHARALAQPAISARVSDIDHADAILVLDTELVEEAPILDLRVRKAVRRNGTRLVVASARPSTLDATAAAALRFAPGAAEAALGALTTALGSARATGSLDDLATGAAVSAGWRPGAATGLNGGAPADGHPAAAGSTGSAGKEGHPAAAGSTGSAATEGHPAAADAVAAAATAGPPATAAQGGPVPQALAGADAVRAAADILRDAGDVVVIWGNRLAGGERGAQTVEALLAVVDALGLADKPESGAIEVPAGANGRGLREVGCATGIGPGLTDGGVPGEGDDTLLLFEANAPEAELARASSIVAFVGFRDEALDEHADVVFPAAVYAEKEGTVTHPDGRLQRVRQALGHPGDARAAWWVLAELCERTGAGLQAPSVTAVTASLAEAVPFYAALTLDEIGGTGVRWQDRDAASALPAAERSSQPLAVPPAAPGGLRVASTSSFWSGPEISESPSLRFLAIGPVAELSLEDARAAGVANGDELRLSAGDEAVVATARVRTGVPSGSVFVSGARLPEGASVELETAVPAR